MSPYSFPVKLVQAAFGAKPEKIWAKRIDLVKDGARALAGYLVYGLGPDAFVLSITELHRETDEDFLNIQKGDLIVVVDGFENKGVLDSRRKILLQILSEEKRRAGLNVEYISPESPYDFAIALNKIRRDMGPISRLDIYSHGIETGAFKINGQWIASDRESSFYDYLRDDLMTENAVIRFNTCLVGKSVSFMRRFGAALMPEGGTVYASKLPTVSSGTAELVEYFTQKDMPPIVDQLQDILIGKLSNILIIGYLQYGENKSEFFQPEWEPIMKVVIE